MKHDVKVDKKDFFRVLLSETPPSDTPIIFSNEGLYRLSKAYSESGTGIDEDLIKIYEDITAIKDSSKSQSGTNPFKYSILRSETKVRGLSLLHPRSQIIIKDFIKNDYPSIIHFCSRSNFSIRKQSRVASYFTPKKDDHNDNSSISSFFAIEGIDRLYKFFESKEFINLESKFPLFATSDISNCFNSIYTHTIPWATHGKDYNSSYIDNKNIFGNRFDFVMQRSNGNETHGIAIGNEISRIFAEILLQKVDIDIENKLLSESLKNGKEYKIFRYVDDYFIFALNREILSTCIHAVSYTLHKLNFTLNESKTKIFERPFFSKNTCAAVQTKTIIAELEKNIFDKYERDSNGDKIQRLKKIYNPRGMASTFISRIRSACLTNDSKFEDVSSLIIGSMRNKINNVNRHSLSNKSEISPVNTLILITEISFFFFKINPQSSNSRTMALIIRIADEIVERDCPEDLQYFREVLKEHINQFLTGKINAELNSSNTKFFPFEKINILLATSFFDNFNKISESELLSIIKDKELNYFDLISIIYYTQGNNKYKNLLRTIEKRIIEILSTSDEISKSSEKCHLSLDIVCCPFISSETRKKILKKNFPSFAAEADVRLQECLNKLDNQFFFVNWKNNDIVMMIAEKELIRGY